MNDILTYASVLFLVAALLVGALIIYGVVRKAPPFKPGTEPKHSWEMTREERRAQAKEFLDRKHEDDDGQPAV